MTLFLLCVGSWERATNKKQDNDKRNLTLRSRAKHGVSKGGNEHFA